MVLKLSIIRYPLLYLVSANRNNRIIKSVSPRRYFIISVFLQYPERALICRTCSGFVINGDVCLAVGIIIALRRETSGVNSGDSCLNDIITTSVDGSDHIVDGIFDCRNISCAVAIIIAGNDECCLERKRRDRQLSVAASQCIEI